MTEYEFTNELCKGDADSPTVHVVDDDPEVRRAISLLAQSVELKVATFTSGQDFLERFSSDQPGCLILDVRMPGMTGLELQQKLIEKGCQIPTILLTAHAEVPMATQAMRAGAVDVIQKPYSPQLLLERIYEAIELDVEVRRKQKERAKIHELVEVLSPREREVMNLLSVGHSTKQIAKRLEISIKTVDNHRSNVLGKMGMDNTAQLARQIAQVEMA